MKLETVIPGTGWVFRCMGIAEEVLAGAPTLPFTACTPSQPISAIQSPTLYRAHVLELAERAAEGASLAPATSAEIAAVMSATSLDAPLNRQAAAVYAWALRDAWSRGDLADVPMPVDLDDIMRGEEYEGAIAEDVARIRRRFAVTERRS